MEPSFPLTNLKTQLCIVVAGYGLEMEREIVWPEGSESFLKRIHKLGVHITVIGPRPPFKLGTKKTVRFLDRHEVVGMKMLAVSRQYRIEFRALNRKLKAWTRIRAEACLAFGPYGILPLNYQGWNSPGTLTLHALSRWLLEQKTLPGIDFAIIGSSNASVRWASRLIDKGARNVYVIESDENVRCWRSHADRFITKGGQLLARHELAKAESQANNTINLYLNNDHGTRVITVSTVVLSAVNEDAFNRPVQWKSGLFYVQRRSIPGEPYQDEEKWLELGDWAEALWRVTKFLGVVDHSEADGAIKRGRNERRHMFNYRNEASPVLKYSGKILDRDTLAFVQTSPSVPRSFAAAKPIASLECFEQVACRACADACSDGAIRLPQLLDLPQLTESRCTGCGACVAWCPSGAAVMVRELPVEQKARYFFADDSREFWRPGAQVQLLNRRGEVVGTGRVVGVTSHEKGIRRVLEIESSNVYLWDARNFRLPQQEEPPFAYHDHERKAWVTINGIRRLCVVGLPINVALWQLGQRRFEDGLFCYDGTCGLCEVRVDGKPVRACKTLVEEGQEITYSKTPAKSDKGIAVCSCKKVDAENRESLIHEGASESLVRELTGIGGGTCHGRWCLSSSELVPPGEKVRPVFYGFEGSPWRDIWSQDVVDQVPEPGPVDVPGTVDLAEPIDSEDDES